MSKVGSKLSFVKKTWSELKIVHWLHLSEPRTLFVRAEKAELCHPSTEPQDYELVEFFIKRIKLWLGLTKAKQVGGASRSSAFHEWSKWGTCACWCESSFSVTCSSGTGWSLKERTFPPLDYPRSPTCLPCPLPSVPPGPPGFHPPVHHPQLSLWGLTISQSPSLGWMSSPTYTTSCLVWVSCSAALIRSIRSQRTSTAWRWNWKKLWPEKGREQAITRSVLEKNLEVHQSQKNWK